MVLPAVLYSAVATLFFTNSALERSENTHLGEIAMRDLARITVMSLFWPAVSAVVAYAVLKDGSQALPSSTVSLARHSPEYQS